MFLVASWHNGYGVLTFISQWMSVSREFESHQRLLLFPSARL